MSNFKIGDKVRVLNNELAQPEEHIGHIFTIKSTGLTMCAFRETTYLYEKYQLELANDFTTPEPQPACKQNQDWMLNHIKDIASETEIERDENWLHEAGTSEAL